ncbi:MAG: Integral rane transport protein [Labilithrix sp.]|nr:Integral rane transport protein [Labilithrix sp.]
MSTGGLSGRARLAAVKQLALMRVRLFVREPGAMFWTFGFPIVLSFVLGIAFRNKKADPVVVAVEMAAAAEAPGPSDRAFAILTDPAHAADLEARRLPAAEADAALRAGRVSLVVVAGPAGYRYRYDATRPESRLAQSVTDDLLQRGEGRKDVFAPARTLVTAPGARYIDFLIPGLIGLGLMSTGLWGVGFSLSEMRTKKLLKRLVATPMRRGDFLFSFLVVRAATLLFELPPLLLFAHYVFGVQVLGSLLVLFLIALVGALTFSVIGLLIACRTESPQVVSGLINAVSFPMYLCSGVFFSASRFPEPLQPLLALLPLTALNDAMRAVMTDGAPLSAVAPKIGVLAAWGVASFVVALRLFRWR